VEAAKPKIMSVKVKPISGVSNQGGTIVFGGGRTLLHIEEEVQELPSRSTWMERSGIMVSTTMSNISTATLKCGSNNVVNDESIGNSKFGDVDCAKRSSVATSNEKRNVITSRATPTNMSSVQDQSSSWGTPFVPSSSKWTQLSSSVNSNSVVSTNSAVGTIVPESSFDCNPVVFNSPEVNGMNPNLLVNSNAVVCKNVEVGLDSDKFCSGALSASNVMCEKDNEAVATIQCSTTVAPESVVDSNTKIVDSTQSSCDLDKSSSVMSTISPSHVSGSKWNDTVSMIKETQMWCKNVLKYCLIAILWLKSVVMEISQVVWKISPKVQLNQGLVVHRTISSRW